MTSSAAISFLFGFSQFQANKFVCFIQDMDDYLFYKDDRRSISFARVSMNTTLMLHQRK